MTGQEVHVAKGARERKLQRALLQYFKPENYFDVHRALEQAGRADLIGDGPECLIRSRPPRSAGKRGKGQQSSGKTTGKAGGYRPHRKTAKKRHRKGGRR